MSLKISYFDQVEGNKNFIKILLVIIGVLIFVNLLIVKSLISIAENKNIRIQVPQFMESGEYVIGGTSASENVYKMWAKVWTQDVSNFSYKDIEEKYTNLYPFLDANTAHKSKSDILNFISFVKENFIQQKFSVNNVVVKTVEDGFVRITVYGNIYRKIGDSVDELNGMKYSYEYLTYVKNGQIYIKSLKTSFYSLNDKRERDKLKNNSYVNFDDLIQ